MGHGDTAKTPYRAMVTPHTSANGVDNDGSHAPVMFLAHDPFRNYGFGLGSASYLKDVRFPYGALIWRMDPKLEPQKRGFEKRVTVCLLEVLYREYSNAGD